jgi:hypothetical protein
MSSTSTNTSTFSFTDEDVAIVMRRFAADLVMIATSTTAITEKEANDYAFDVGYLAKNGFLKFVDVTLMSGGVEVTATRFEVVVGSDELKSSRPGGLVWPKVASPFLRVYLRYTDAYTAAERTAATSKLKHNWSPSSADVSHSALTSSTSRDYSSNGFGVSRKDFK